MYELVLSCHDVLSEMDHHHKLSHSAAAELRVRLGRHQTVWHEVCVLN